MTLMGRKYLWIGFVLFFLFFIGSACKPTASESVEESETAMNIQVSSNAFTEGGTIPVKYTCDGENVSPPLVWSGIPESAQSVVVIMDDPDAPVGTWVHWVLYDLSLDINALDEGEREVGVAGVNSWNKPEYGGPCPPPGKPHRYYFKLYALDTELYLQSGATKADIEKAMQGHILAEGQLMGEYGR